MLHASDSPLVQLRHSWCAPNRNVPAAVVAVAPGSINPELRC